jgi:hypothetical protein
MKTDNYRQTTRMHPLAKMAIILPCVAAGTYIFHKTIKTDWYMKEYEKQQIKTSQVHEALGKERERAHQLKLKQIALEKRVKELTEHLEIDNRGILEELGIDDYISVCTGSKTEPGSCTFMHQKKLRRELCKQSSPPKRYRGSR